MELPVKRPFDFTYRHKIVTSRRDDDATEYRVTLPKALCERAMSGHVVGGRFVIMPEIEYIIVKGQPKPAGEPRLKIEFFSSSIEPTVYESLWASRWVPLACPFCHQTVRRPFWNEASEGPESEVLKCQCGAEYYVDLVGDEPLTDWIGEGETKVVHNYYPALGVVGTDLDPLFDVLHETPLAHVFFHRVPPDDIDE